MKRKLFNFFVAFILIFSMVTVSVCAGEYSWYCKRTKDHSQPPLPSEFNFISEHNGYYLDLKPTDKVVYLTFDAGYENGNVAKTLDILKQNSVSGAFFILSNLITTSPDVVKRMVSEGHTVCNHTSTHKDMSKIQDYGAFEKELASLELLYKEKIGEEISKYFRPPEGRFSEKTIVFAERMNYKTVFWSFAYADWDNNNQMSCEQAKKKILDNIHNGAVLLLHPTSNVNAAILDDVIKEIKAMGYRFGTLDELTGNNET